MTKSHNSTSKCFSDIFRRLLCTGSLPTHPSDLITDSTTTIPTTTFENSTKDFKTQVKTPGVVARLMGLDSLPDLNLVPKDSPILRSRSVNSVNYFPDFDPTLSHHRRVKTSLSFREVPTFLQQQQQQPKKHNLDFFVLCLEKVDGNGGNKMGLSSDMALKDLKQKEMKTEGNRENLRERKFENKRKVFRRKEDQPNRVCGNCSSTVDNVNLDRKNKEVVQRQPRESLRVKKSGVKHVNQKEIGSELKIGNKTKSRNNIAKKVPQSVCVSDNLSPVSVIDLHHHSLSFHHESTSAGHTNVTISNSRSSNATDNDSNNPSSNYTRNFIADEHHVIKAKKNRDDKAKQTSETQYYDIMLTEILRLTEEGIEETHWVNEKVIEFEDAEEICTVFGQQILDLLFHQVVDELVLCNMNRFAL